MSTAARRRQQHSQLNHAQTGGGGGSKEGVSQQQQQNRKSPADLFQVLVGLEGSELHCCSKELAVVDVAVAVHIRGSHEGLQLLLEALALELRGPRHNRVGGRGVSNCEFVFGGIKKRKDS